MLKYVLLFMLFPLIMCAQNTNQKAAMQLLKAYSDFIGKIDHDTIYWKDGSKTIFDDKKVRSLEELDETPDVEDMFKYTYRTGKIDTPATNHDPGRIRDKSFFKKMYGKTQKEVESKLVTITWMPKTVNKKIRVTSVNGVDKKLKAISDELEALPELKKYLNNPAGGYMWRNILGTDNLSPHSFGICFDVNVNQSHYWRWDYKNDKKHLNFKNKIPVKVVEIFEKHGFIWGGRWYHYDTMHFEYRPELLK